ncbi:preprotein translocase subunit SecG [Candidatus Saccharibacteria bacterium]|nr:preprotein translocase subunit SecG [Candidatus Saccharibacteria bacterium]
MGNTLEIITLVSAVLVILLILIQQRGATLGSGSGSSSELYTTRRGLEKSLFVTTIFFTCVFVLSILGLLIIPA